MLLHFSHNQPMIEALPLVILLAHIMLIFYCSTLPVLVFVCKSFMYLENKYINDVTERYARYLSDVHLFYFYYKLVLTGDGRHETGGD